MTWRKITARDKLGRIPAVGRIERICDHCGKPMQLSPWQANRRLGQNKFCSKACCYAGREVTQTFQQGHPNLLPAEVRRANGHKISKALTGKKLSADHCKKIGDSKRGRKLTRTHIRKSLRRRPMSSLEIKFNDIIVKHALPYKFVGNGDFFIERKNPDFVNCNGEKIAVEVYYRKHKEQFSGGLKHWRRNRHYLFAKYGWRLWFFDETQVKERYVVQRLGGNNF
jgi:hypothetical protein